MKKYLSVKDWYSRFDVPACLRRSCLKSRQGFDNQALIVRAMRITIFLTLACVVNLYATGYSQEKLTLSLKDVKLSQVFRVIQRHTNYQFLYNDEEIAQAPLVSVSVKNATVPQILAICFTKNYPLAYKIKDSTVIVLKKVAALHTIKIPTRVNKMPQFTVKGKVTDSLGNPLVGVSVSLKGTQTGTITDADGNYSLTLESGNGILVFSYVGYAKKEVAVNGRTTINVQMSTSVSSLNQLVVIGYGTQRKKDLTGSVSQVSSKELNAVPVFRVEQALQGRAAGVVVTKNSGQPGGDISIRIRGANSIIGDNEPLYVVDGFPIKGGIDFLNPSDIESISILKDASATAIYGARGSNGVVIITTKSGNKNSKGRIELNSYYGTQKAIKRYHMLNAKQYAIVANEYLKNSGLDPYWSQNEIDALGKGTDWWDEFINPAPIQRHTLSVSGGGNKTTYSWSLSYLKQEGILSNSSAKKGNSSLNLTYEVNSRIKLGLNLILSRNKISIHPHGNLAWHNGLLDAPSTLKVYDEDGNFTKVGSVYGWTLGNIPNPGVYSDPYKNETMGNFVLANTSIKVKITDRLTFDTRNGLNYRYNHDVEFAPNDRFYPDLPEADDGYIRDGLSYSNSFLSENTLRYLNTFNNRHKIKILAGITYQKHMNRSTNIEVNELASNITKNYDLSGAGLIHTPSSGFSEWTLLSGIGRVNYIYNDKYFVTGSFRADASSRFGANNKWGYFPSVAVAWNLSKEPFMANFKVINNLKIRSSYGFTGNTAINPYQSLNRLSTSIAVLGSNSNTIGYAPSNVGNSDLKWETTKQLDIGLDLDILENRLSFTFDYYRKVTSDLLASVPLPPSTGFNSVLKNIGKIENQGFEFSVRADVLSREFKWNIFAQASINENTILALANGDDIVGPTFGHPFESSLNIMRVGQPMAVFYGLLEDGFDDDGNYKYKDINKDGVVNSSDRVIIGKPNPKLIYSFNNDFTYKNFNLNIFFQGVEGRDIFWATAGVNLSSFQDGLNQFADLFGNYWTPGKKDAKYQKVSNEAFTRVSDKYVEDGSYLRLKSITLSYHIPINRIQWLKEAEIYCRGTNLLTITNYPGLDPEVNTRGNTNFKGVDQDAYPSTKEFIIGAKITF